MGKLPENYVEKVYSGWLGKLIGIRLGAPVEIWTHEAIKKSFGEVDGYIVDYKDFAADDDSNGPAFFIRTLEDYSLDPTPEQMGLSWLNYIPFEKSFLWWGGYGISTEHTAYLNMRNGIMPPRSGAIEQNGAQVAEQIGGQIFVDTWGLVAPANPKKAAELAKRAACVSHDGEGVYGGMFVAACISAAFAETDLLKIIEEGLGVIPKTSEYAKVTRAVMDFYSKNPHNWEDCLRFLEENYWDDKYGGNCHIIPNAGIMILALMYGQGDFSKTLCICNMCGFDTDCNVANIGTIMGVQGGLSCIDYEKWRKPINDFYVCSSVVGSLNIQDAANFSLYLADLGYKLAGEAPAEDILKRKARFHFEMPGATHGFRVESADVKNLEYLLSNT